MTRLAFRLPKLGHTCLAGLLLALVLPGIRPAAAASVDCPDAGLLGPALLESICWDCVFPIRFGGSVIGDGDVPDGAADGAVCVCDDNRGVPHLGLTFGMWEPAGLFEIVRSPGCSPILGGTKIEATGSLMRGSRGGTLYDKGDRAFYHYHMWKFPLLAMLELFTPTECVRDGGIEVIAADALPVMLRQKEAQRALLHFTIKTHHRAKVAIGIEAKTDAVFRILITLET